MTPTTRPIATRVRTAAVEHPCALCGGPIQPGERYRRVVIVQAEEIVVETWHLPTGLPDDPCRPKPKGRRG